MKDKHSGGSRPPIQPRPPSGQEIDYSPRTYTPREKLLFGIHIPAIGLAAVVLIFLAAGCTSGAYTYEKVNNSGIVVARDKDSGGKVTSVEIKTESAASFIVENSGKGKELLEMIDKKVEISGKARPFQGGKLLTVETYKVLG